MQLFGQEGEGDFKAGLFKFVKSQKQRKSLSYEECWNLSVPYHLDIQIEQALSNSSFYLAKRTCLQDKNFKGPLQALKFFKSY